MFGALLSITEGRRTLEKLRLARVAIWGGLGANAAALPPDTAPPRPLG